MSEVVTGGAPAPEAQSSVPGFFGGLPPGAPVTTGSPQVQGVVPTETKPVEPPPPPAAPTEPKQPEEKVRLAAAIREAREVRQAREREAQEARTLATHLEELRAENAALKSAQAFEADPVGYAKSRKWTPEEQALYGQSLLYDLVPEKAPAELRYKLLESKQERKEREAREQAEVQRREAQKAAETQQIGAYVASLDQAARALEPGSLPESEAWFGDDHDSYVKSLFATANNLAEVARAQGQVADLSPGAVARALEQEVRARMERRDARVAQRTKKPEPAAQAPVSGAQSTQVGHQAQGQPISTKGLGSGPPRPPAQTEDERIARAAEALFGKR